MLLDPLHQPHVLALHHAEGDALLPKAPRPPDAVQVGLEIRLALLAGGEAEVHHDGDLLHVDPWRRERAAREGAGKDQRPGKSMGKGKGALGFPEAPLAQTLVAMRTFSFPSRKRWMTLARWATVSSAVRMATWCPSWLISTASQSALLRVWTGGGSSSLRFRSSSALAAGQPCAHAFPPPGSPAPFEGAPGAF